MDKNTYIKTILGYIKTDKITKKRIKEDLIQRISQAEENDPYFNFIEEIGQPKEVAIEFMENLDYEGGPKIIISSLNMSQHYEYKSKTKVFGLALIHINAGGGKSDTRIAKGIIAIGDVAIGLISLGGVSMGLISVGGVSLGLAALGGVAIGGFALGGVAIGLFALGGVALGLFKVLGFVGITR